MYSHFVPDLHGETMPPQAHANAPWIDEVHQSVSVNTNLNYVEGQCNGETCPAYYIHGAGTYQKDNPYTSTPFYSQSLAKHCDEATCTFAAWGQQAHLATIFTSPIITLNRFTNCGDGIIEHTEMIYNFAPTDYSSPHLIDQGYFNVPWSGVRPSNLPIALEPDPLSGELSYEDPDTVDYCPMCGWGLDEQGGAQGRCARDNLQNLGGYTSFVGHGLYVNTPEPAVQKPSLWCRKPGADCTTAAATCMATPDECYNEDGSVKEGYTPVILEVPALSNPDCRDRGEFANGRELKCKMHRTGFGNTNPNLSSSVPCAPWAKMKFYREDTNEGFEATFIRHWSNSPADQYLFFRVDAPSFAAAKDMVHNAFDNSGNSGVLSIKFEAAPPTITQENVPAGYNPGALPSVTFVAGDGTSPLTPGNFRRRLGNGYRDYYVYTNNYLADALEAGYALSKRAFFFASELAAVKATADELKSKVVYDLIEDTRYNPRAIDIYKSGASFDAVAATSTQGTATTCSTSPSATRVCSGFSTPKPGYSPFFYVTCGDSTYLGPDPYFFTPGNGDWFTFPGMSNNNTKMIRSYACEGQDETIRPTWKLIGFFDSACLSSVGSDVTYDDDICVAPSEEPSSLPSSQPSSQPSSSVVPTPEPSLQPSSTLSLQPSSSLVPTPEPSPQPSSQPSLQPSPAPTLTKKYLWCSKPGGCNSSNEASCMAPPSECYTEDGYGSVKPDYTPIELFVLPNTTPQCRDRGQYGTDRELKCKFHTTGFGRTRPYIRPPAGSTMGFYREDNMGFEATFIRHWSWRSHGQWVYLRVKANDYVTARNLVHANLNNGGNSQPLPLKFEMRELFE